MKKLIALLALITIALNVTKVNAEESIYYTNDNGVSLTEKEYIYITSMFDENYATIMTSEDYENLQKIDVNNYEITYYEPSYVQTRSTTNETASKKLAISKSCAGTACQIMISNTWKAIPKVKSYDVLGNMLVNTSYTTDPVITVFTNDSGNHVCTSSEIVEATNGVGCSHKIGTSTHYYSSQVFSVYTGGTVLASYQHASSSISLANSKKYSFSLNGYGNVFLFSTNAGKNAYDSMGGVSIVV